MDNIKFAEEFCSKMFPLGDGASAGFTPIAYNMKADTENSQIVQHMAHIVAQVFANPAHGEPLKETKARADVAVGTFICMIGQFHSGVCTYR